MILYAEDNEDIWKSVVAYLEAEWFIVDRCKDGTVVLAMLWSKRYDCYILDIMMPWVDWRELCEHIRAKTATPIIMTTARWTIDDKTKAYKQWADDYLVKPFSLEELVLRINAVMKRTAVWEQLSFWDITVYFEENRLTKGGEEIALPLKEWLLLIELIEAKWMVVTRLDLIDLLWWWASAFDQNDNKLDVYIANLRKKIGKTHIETVKGVGYRIVL